MQISCKAAGPEARLCLYGYQRTVASASKLKCQPRKTARRGTQSRRRLVQPPQVKHPLGVMFGDQERLLASGAVLDAPVARTLRRPSSRPLAEEAYREAVWPGAAAARQPPRTRSRCWRRSWKSGRRRSSEVDNCECPPGLIIPRSHQPGCPGWLRCGQPRGSRPPGRSRSARRRRPAAHRARRSPAVTHA